MIPLDRSRLDILTKLAKFIVVGASGVIVNYAVLIAAYDLVGPHLVAGSVLSREVALVAASVLAVEVAIVNNYLWNNWWTFGRRNLSALGFAKFNIVSLGGLAITTFTLYVLAIHGGINYLLANMVGITIATFWNFGINLRWTWRGGG
ncbi:MAG: GtrA family protein [Chloroflexi bacterium]|nr:GtrA family protein [Chloroflexota bacterium]